MLALFTAVLLATSLLDCCCRSCSDEFRKEKGAASGLTTPFYLGYVAR